MLSMCGCGMASPTFTLSSSPTSLNFGTQNVGTSSSQLTVTLTNNGSRAVTVQNASVSSTAFTLAGLNGSVSLSPGANLTLQVAFTPTAATTYSANLTVSGNHGVNLSVPLSGVGASGTSGGSVAVSVSPATATVHTGGTQQFAATVTGTTNTAVNWSVANGGGTISTTGLYTAPATAGTASVMATSVASPSSSGLANVTINTPSTVSVSASPTSIAFGSVLVGSSASKAVTLTNTGTSSATISSASATGSGFTVSGLQFPLTLAAGASAAATVTFAPSGSGTNTGTASWVSNATNSPTTVALSGSGTSPTQHSVTLNWQASASTVSGYHIYRSATTGGPYSILNSTLDSNLSYNDSTVQSGTTYYYVVTGVDSTGVESGYSNQVTVVVPSP